MNHVRSIDTTRLSPNFPLEWPISLGQPMSFWLCEIQLVEKPAASSLLMYHNSA